MRRHYRVTVVLTALALLLASAALVLADVGGAIAVPIFGLGLTLTIMALQAVILTRVVRGPRPWRESAIANTLAVTVGLVLALGQVLNWVDIVPRALSQSPWGDVVFYGVCFLATSAVELAYLSWRWREQGFGRVLAGVLTATVATYALLVPLYYVLEERLHLLTRLLDM